MNGMPDESAIIGCLLGTAVGDALGLPYEGLSPRRAARLLGPPDRYRFLLRYGMVSDDTEHTCLVAQSLIAAGTEPDAFIREFARRLRWWLLGLPAGLGRATLRSVVKLWLGCSPDRSSVFSAGNGPSMRAAIFGAAVSDQGLMLELVRRCARVTHSDSKAEHGAVVIALAAATARSTNVPEPDAFADHVADVLGPEDIELSTLLGRVAESVASGESTGDFATKSNLADGVSGYVYHTVPVSIHAWLSHPRDYRNSVTAVIECGGDADTTAAIVGGLVGTAVGPEGIPDEWLGRLIEWPRSVRWMTHLGHELTSSLERGTPARSPGVKPIAVCCRNLLFLAVVLWHGLRRLLPPY